MALLNKHEQAQVSTAINTIEQKTTAELVTVLAARSDDYHYIPLLWAAFCALLLPLLLIWVSPLETTALYLVQLVVFVSLSLIFRLPMIHYRLIPAYVRHWRAANMARRQFLENNLHHTRGETGVLIFVSEAEHYVEIIADRGISQHVDDAQWADIINDFTHQVKAGNTLQGFLDCIARCGALLAEHAPAESENTNELPNHLIIIDD